MEKSLKEHLPKGSLLALGTPGGILEKITGTITGGNSKDFPGAIPEAMLGETPWGVLEKISAITHDGITKESYGKNPRGIHRCILAEVSVKKSEEIVGGIPEAFLGTNPEKIIIGTLQDAHGRIHEGDIFRELPWRIPERIAGEVPEGISEGVLEGNLN